MHAGARRVIDRAVQADDEVEPWQRSALKTEAFPHDALDEIPLRRASGQLLCHNDAHASRIELVGPVMHDQVLPFYGAPKSKNG